MQLEVKSKGQSLNLDPSAILGTGGEANVFALSQNARLVAKVYHQPTKTHARKLGIMLANPPGDPMARRGHISIAWPVDLLQTANRDVVGFLMPCVTGMSSILDFYNPQIRRQKCPLFSYQYLHRTARNLATAVGALHRRGYVIGDLNESNILVSDTALVTVVDTDSFQVPDPKTGHTYRCPVGKPEFTPPELQGITFADIDRQPQHDLFGLAVLIFQLLMEGFHPFTGVYKGDGDPPPLETRIAEGHFPYGRKWRLPYDPSPLAPDLDMLDPRLKRLFFRCFESGHRHPRRRPDANAWVKALKKAERSLVVCDRNEQHFYGNHLRDCPWCERAARFNGRDPFPSPQAIRHGNPQMSPAKQTPLPPAKTRKPSSSRRASSASGTSIPPRRSGKKWFVLLVILLGGWLATRVDWPDFTPFTKDLPEPREVQTQEAEAPANAIRSAPVPQPNPQMTIENRFRKLDQPGLSVGERARRYEAFLNDFRRHPDAGDDIRQVKDRWEKMAYDEMGKAYRAFLAAPEAKAVRLLLKTAQAYLQHHDRRRDTATGALRLAQWHLDAKPHPLKLYIDQGNKLYVKVISNDVVYAETKKGGRFVSVALPQYRSGDRVRIEAYQDDMLEDTNLGKAVSLNRFKGNHALSIADRRGDILVQIVFEDFPGHPKF